MTYDEAYDDLLSHFTRDWTEETVEVFYEALEEDRPANKEPFIVIKVANTGGGQRTLGKNNRHFGRTGIVTIILYSPTGNGLSESNRLANVAVNSFEGKSTENGIWFKNVRLSEGGRDGIYIVNQVFAEFDYSVIK